MDIKVTDIINQKSYDKIVEILVEYNLSKTKEFNSEINKPIEIIARNEKKEIIGGLYGRSIWGTLEIKTFAIKPENRNNGIGKKLLLEAEKEAKNRNCRFISLDTFSFQAPAFYEKLGFEKIGTESDFPKGFEKYYYRKKI
ncbi:GNAT family N-acetyltransferase [Riemerella anatipestifer]|jgi:ribosomal protein S18 acetylase RimI-like enzyme|uniref:GNAT family N-acetyltransferase n=1 Tax=Riemerella anatipestifer TaxID=34085 RepID=UPI00129EAC22|nr:GNAT family N-acetyltransferase [Riemerella anatipestifer]MDY3319864.1 GNAT family N-acetyltransferase [Riemerella anatipestifer]MDY3326131.1 GNAT family N-acetyltransferase [Riemerella anatipestifer]MDY3354481.1 GNAT family N-acetyltransferase [Riemerella anatipestifer]MRM82670.1 GNAT family N-acetyltransferase [Riemerella anatipestifer]